MAKRSHPFPCRTRKLSSSAPMVVGGSPPVRVGRRQAISFRSSSVVELSAVNRSVASSNLACGAIASIAQQVECFHGKEEVTGSSPVGSFYIFIRNGPLVKRLRHRPFTAVTRVRIPYGSPKFFCKSKITHQLHIGGLAQLGEHLPYKQRVGGSIPSSSTKFFCECKMNLIFLKNV
jgi:hypothetical protein